jgi:hypothetical protein
VRLADLSPEMRRRIAEIRWDRFIEKHEGPWPWKSWIEHDDVDFLTVDGNEVLFPIEKANHANISILRCIPSADGSVLTIFLTDTTFYEEMFAGALAICEKVPGEDWYLTLVYHDWFVIPDVATQFRAVAP